MSKIEEAFRGLGRTEKVRFSRGVEYNQYFHRKKLILKTKKNDYG